jgi:hypothetical protein
MTFRDADDEGVGGDGRGGKLRGKRQTHQATANSPTLGLSLSSTLLRCEGNLDHAVYEVVEASKPWKDCTCRKVTVQGGGFPTIAGDDSIEGISKRARRWGRGSGKKQRRWVSKKSGRKVWIRDAGA